MSVGAGLYMYAVVVKKFTFAISSSDEFLSLYLLTVRNRAKNNCNYRLRFVVHGRGAIRIAYCDVIDDVIMTSLMSS